MMKKINILIAILLIISCNDQTDVLKENATRGAFVQFSGGLNPKSNTINLLKFAEYKFSEEVEDPNDNIISYNLTLSYGDIVVEDFIVITSFPAQLAFTGQQIIDAGIAIDFLTIDFADINTNNTLHFLATVTTTTGVYDARITNFNFDTNTQEGGQSSESKFLTASSGSPINQAMDFKFSLFIPPPKKLKGTSFEEPFGASAGSDYTRPSADANRGGELFNNTGQRHVMHAASGNGVDDELGFRTFFVSTSRSGFTTEEIGVSKDPAQVGGSFLDGEQAYQVEDTDGIIQIVFDEVTIDPAINPKTGIQISYYPIDIGNLRETNDFLKVSAFVTKADGSSETITLININGIGTNSRVGKWNLADSGFLDNITSYVLTVEAAYDSGEEDIYFDQMLVYIQE